MRTLKVASWISLFSIAVALSSGCGHAPKAASVAPQPPTIDRSSISIITSINSSDIEAAVLRRYDTTPIFRGRSEELKAVNLLATEKVPYEEQVEELVSAAVPGVCTVQMAPRVVKRTVQTGTRIVRCVGRLLRLRSCSEPIFSEIAETILEPVRKCTEPQLATYKRVARPAFKGIDKIVPTSIWLNHEEYLKTLEIVFDNDVVQVDADIDFRGAIDVQAGVLNAVVNTKGALACRGKLAVSIEGKLLLNQAGHIQIMNLKSSVDIKEACVPGAVQAFDFAKISQPWLHLVHEALARKISDRINEQIIEAIARQDEKLDLQANANRLQEKLSAPRKISRAENVWLLPSIAGFTIGSPVGIGKGAENRLQTIIGITARPVVVLSASVPAPDAIGRTGLSVGSVSPSTKLLLRASVPYSEGARRVTNLAKEWCDNNLTAFRYCLGQARLYMTEDNKLAIDLEVVARQDNAVVGHVYLVGVVGFDVAKDEFFVRDLQFTVETKNALVALTSLFESQIEKHLERKLTWSAKDDLEKLYSVSKNFSTTDRNGQWSGEFERAGVQTVYLSLDAMNVVVTTHGILRYQVFP